MKKETEWVKKIIETQMNTLNSLDLKDKLISDYYFVLKDIQDEILKERYNESLNKMRLCKRCNKKSLRKEWDESYDPRSGWVFEICPKCGASLIDVDYEDLN